MPAKYPWSDLVALVTRFAPKPGSVLELGCGETTPNFWFFSKEGWKYTGIDLSVATGHRYNPADYPPNIHFTLKGNFTKITLEDKFDLICDRASLSHNPKQAIIQTIANYRNSLSPGGLYIGVDWHSRSHYAYHNQQFALAKKEFGSNPTPHFVWDLELKRDIFPNWEFLWMEQKTLWSNTEEVGRGFINFVARPR